MFSIKRTILEDITRVINIEDRGAIVDEDSTDAIRAALRELVIGPGINGGIFIPPRNFNINVAKLPVLFNYDVFTGQNIRIAGYDMFTSQISQPDAVTTPYSIFKLEDNVSITFKDFAIQDFGAFGANQVMVELTSLGGFCRLVTFENIYFFSDQNAIPIKNNSTTPARDIRVINCFFDTVQKPVFDPVVGLYVVNSIFRLDGNFEAELGVINVDYAGQRGAATLSGSNTVVTIPLLEPQPDALYTVTANLLDIIGTPTTTVFSVANKTTTSFDLTISLANGFGNGLIIGYNVQR